MNEPQCKTKDIRPLFALAWLAIGIGLSVAATILGNQYPLDTDAVYTIGHVSDVVYWADDRRVLGRMVHQLDLKSGHISKVLTRQLGEYGFRNGRGWRVWLLGGLEVVDDQSGELIWHGALPSKSAYAGLQLIGDHWLVEPIKDGFVVYDLRELVKLNEPARMDTSQVDALQMTIACPGVLATVSGVTHLMPIQGTSRFLYHHVDASPATFSLFEIEGSSLKTIAAWQTTKDSVTILNGETVLTAAASLPEVEVRSTVDGQLIKRMPVPAGLNSWAGLILYRSGLFSFTDAKTGTTRLHRLDDFSAVEEYQLSVLEPASMFRQRESRFVLLNDGSAAPQSYVVYDTLEKRGIVVPAPTARAIDYTIVNDQLVVVTGLMGLTVEMFELKTGKLSRRLQPFASLLLWLPAILLLALGWLIVWLRVSSHWPRWAVANIVILAVLFMTPQLLHAASVGNIRQVARPALCYCCNTLIGFSCVSSLYAVFGRHRILLRSLAVWLNLACVLALLNVYPIDSTNPAFANNPYRGIQFMYLHMLLVFGLICTAAMLLIRAMGFRLARRTASGDVSSPRVKVPLSDIFVFTAGVALFMAAAAPHRSFLLSTEPLITSIIGSLLWSGPAMLGLVALVPSLRIYRFMRTIAFGLALYCIVEITIHLGLTNYQGQPWYMMLLIIRMFVFTYLTTFTIGMILRNAGYRWQRAFI